MAAHIAFKTEGKLASWIADSAVVQGAGGSASLAARGELEVWVAVTELALRDLDALSVAEWSCVCDVLNGAMLTPVLGAVLAAELSDAFRPGRLQAPDAFGAKWAIDEQELREWALMLSPVADYAARRAVALWWAKDADASADGFESVGLPVRETAA